ncbi:MAG: PqqD family peptide modification chaperone [Chloroflexi bacterium]|nr:PqqD family peptide modification chaperone [Chloroflexota bacterium]
MTLWRNLKARIAPALPSPTPGLYHFTRVTPLERSRIHLRIDPDGSGLLLVNASRVMHLNPTAAFMAHLALAETPAEQVTKALTHAYQVSPRQAQQDYADFTSQLEQLIRPDGACPVHELEVETILPFSARPSAPYRMDLALSYRCNNDCAHCYNQRPRTFPSLSTDEWKQVLDRLWQVAIPHIVFTGGEPTLRPDLPDLVAHAQKNGQITGLNTNGRRLQDAAYVQSLVDAGLDHVQITLESHDAHIHDEMVSARGAWQQTVAGLRNALDSPLFVMTNTTMLQQNSPYLTETLDFLGALGVPTIGLNALIYAGHGLTAGSGLRESELAPLLTIARDRTDHYQQRLIWYTPTEYCQFDPMQLELGVKGCTAALYNMCVEPDGSVIPCQSYYQPLGNMLNDPWESIWNHSLARSLRERQDLPARCSGCALLPECGGGCPLKTLHENGKEL